MPLPLPHLDDRRWADLIGEGRALITPHAPEWTDHNIHDPGITLIDLFAWLTEMAIYRLNQVPEPHRRRFLQLIGYLPLPPRPATAMMHFSPPAGSPTLTLPAGVEFAAVTPELKTIPWRTERDLDISPLEIAAMLVENPPGSFEDRTRDLRDGVSIVLFGSAPAAGATLYLGFETLPTLTPLSLGFEFKGPRNDATERERIILEARKQAAACRPATPQRTCPGTPAPAPASTALPLHHSARLTWEVFAGGAWTPLTAVALPARPAPGEVMDDTRSLTLDGIVEVNLPAGIQPTVVGSVANPLFYLRCRLSAGAFDAPPIALAILCNAVVAQQCIPVWQAFALPPALVPSGPAPAPGATTRVIMHFDAKGAISQLDFHTAATLNGPDIPVFRYQPPGPLPGALALEAVYLGVGSGLPDQQFRLQQAPVEVERFRLFTLHGSDWQEWIRRENFDASTLTDWHFILEPTTGSILLGNGDRGRTSPPGAAVFALYRATLAADGRTGAGAIGRLADSPQNDVLLSSAQQQALKGIISNRPSAGGEDAETLAAASGRAIETLHAHERLVDLADRLRRTSLDQIAPADIFEIAAPARAINILDIERVAFDVPGTRIARARAWANRHPDFPCFAAPGVITLVVLPDMPIPKPEPSAGLLAAVRRYLGRHRMITARIEVRGPQYLEVRVTARLQLQPGANPPSVVARVTSALNAFLDPRKGGPDGLGWPFGRDVYQSEILQIIDNVPGVDHVLGITLSGSGGEPQCGNIPLCPGTLTTPGQHRIEVLP